MPVLLVPPTWAIRVSQACRRSRSRLPRQDRRMDVKCRLMVQEPGVQAVVVAEVAIAIEDMIMSMPPNFGSVETPWRNQCAEGSRAQLFPREVAVLAESRCSASGMSEGTTRTGSRTPSTTASRTMSEPSVNGLSKVTRPRSGSSTSSTVRISSRGSRVSSSRAGPIARRVSRQNRNSSLLPRSQLTERKPHRKSGAPGRDRANGTEGSGGTSSLTMTAPPRESDEDAGRRTRSEFYLRLTP